jgi:hypothetical protein
VSAIHDLVAQLEAIEAELEALWQANGKPKGKAWETLAAPLWARQEAVEDVLAPALFAWAADEGLVGYSIAGFLVIEYAKVKKGTGIKMHGSRIRNLIEHVMYVENIAGLRAEARSMTEAEWAEYEAGFCTTTQEGKNTLAVMREARAA